MAVKTTQEPEQPDPFRNFDLAEQWAYTYKTLGASGLLSHFSDFDDPEIREILRQNDLGDIVLWKELLIDQADELSAMGLSQVAKVCLQEAARRPSEFDRPNEWSAAEEQHWHEKMQRDRKRWEAERATSAW
jgi:hypothetical protein